MSEVERHVGKVKKIDMKGMNSEEWCKAKCKELSIEKQRKWYNSWEETLFSEVWPVKYVEVCGEFWEILEDKKEEDFEDISIMHPNEDGTFSYIFQFYNGGTCLREMLEEELLNKYDKSK